MTIHQGNKHNEGYHDCPCRDCFEIAIGVDDDGAASLCNECEEAGCDREGCSECEAPGAYGGQDEDPALGAVLADGGD